MKNIYTCIKNSFRKFSKNLNFWLKTLEIVKKEMFYLDQKNIFLLRFGMLLTKYLT